MAENAEYQNKRLGDLTDDLLRERLDTFGNDLYGDSLGGNPGATVKSGDFPGDTGQDVPRFETTVQSTFDTRPVNATDFYITSQGDTTGDTCTGTPPITLFNYTVPAGYIAVVRDIDLTNFIGGTVTAQGVVDTGQMTAFVDDTPQQGINQVLIPMADHDYVAHFIADENNTITVQIDGFQAGQGQFISVIGILRGNLLLKRGLPLNMEIGTLA